MTIRIVVEDRDFLIVEKPPGVATQPLPLTSNLKNADSNPLSRGGRGVPSLAEILAARYPELRTVGGSDWGVAHRLDRETSGLVVFARPRKRPIDDVHQQRARPAPVIRARRRVRIDEG